MLKLNEFAKEIYENAVAHGWYDEPRPFPRLCCLFIGELAESHEEARKNMPNEYEENGKPEGVAVEMADCAIRILDYLGSIECDIDRFFETKLDFIRSCDFPCSDLERTILEVASYIDMAYRLHCKNIGNPERFLYSALAHIIEWFSANALDFMDIARRKHEYNKTRPYKHGKAF